MTQPFARDFYRRVPEQALGGISLMKISLQTFEISCKSHFFLFVAELLAMHQVGDVIPFLQNIPSRL